MLHTSLASIILLSLSAPAFTAPTSPTNLTVSLALQTYSTHLASDSLDNRDVAEVKINGIKRRLIVDTGSSDTWVFGNSVTCATAQDVHVASAECHIGELYPTPVHGSPDAHMDLSYGDGQRVTGVYANATFEIANITIPKQQIAYANHMDQVFPFYGLEGILGLGPRAGEGARQGPYIHGVSGGRYANYPTVFESMYLASHQLQPVFSLALSRGNESMLTFGGTAPVKSEGDTVRVPFSSLNPASASRHYAVQADGINVEGHFFPTSYEYIVDNGAPHVMLPQIYADKIAKACKPPAQRDIVSGVYIVECNAKMPKTGVQFNGKTFFIDGEDMIIRHYPIVNFRGQNLCRLMISPSLKGNINLLGRPFLQSVVADFDVGKKEMRFTQRG